MPARRLRRPLETWQSVMITLGTENDANETTGPNKAIPISIRKPDVLIKDTRPSASRRIEDHASTAEDQGVTQETTHG